MKGLLLGLFSLLATNAFAQTSPYVTIESKVGVTAFEIQSDNLEELKNFDWSVVKDIVKNNDEEQWVEIKLSYLNTTESNRTKTKVDKFSVKSDGKTTDIEKVIGQIKKLVNAIYGVNTR